jgi:hypothetical protein
MRMVRGRTLTEAIKDYHGKRQAGESDSLEVQATMPHWQQDSDLAPVRGEQALAVLSPEDRLAWAGLWRDVAALLERGSRK